ncbi:MAG: type II toxin-antitoxin system PemK/MazF family toxin [Bacteroidales bacterium]|nr:type II toxin-antitoxin system PemK/MazF family toxin [Bacteroidales bacterium]
MLPLIVLVNLEYSPGSEIRKTRSCVVVSPDEMNHYLQAADHQGTGPSFPT